MSSFFLRDRTHILPSPSIPTQCMACGRPRSRSFGSSRNLSSPMSICWYFSGLRRDRCAEGDSCGDLRFFFFSIPCYHTDFACSLLCRQPIMIVMQQDLISTIAKTILSTALKLTRSSKRFRRVFRALKRLSIFGC